MLFINNNTKLQIIPFMYILDKDFIRPCNVVKITNTSYDIINNISQIVGHIHYDNSDEFVFNGLHNSILIGSTSIFEYNLISKFKQSLYRLLKSKYSKIKPTNFDIKQVFIFSEMYPDMYK